MRKGLFFGCLFVFGVRLEAHPVAYQGSIGVMSNYQGERTDFQVNYSAYRRLALGADVTHIQRNSSDSYYGMGRVNMRLYRRNEMNSQGNVYAYIGTGVHDVDGLQKGAGTAGFQMDWESRQRYVLLAGQSLISSGQKPDQQISARIGAAPYLAEYDGLHSWLMLQAMYESYGIPQFSLTPFIRQFYKNVLWEFGVSLKGQMMFNTIIHF